MREIAEYRNKSPYAQCKKYDRRYPDATTKLVWEYQLREGGKTTKLDRTGYGYEGNQRDGETK